MVSHFLSFIIWQQQGASAAFSTKGQLYEDAAWKFSLSGENCRMNAGNGRSPAGDL